MTFTVKEIADDLESTAKDFSNSASVKLVLISYLLNEAAIKLRHMDAKTPEPAANPLQAQLDDARRQLATQDALIENLSVQVCDLQSQLDAAKLAGVTL